MGNVLYSDQIFTYPEQRVSLSVSSEKITHPASNLDSLQHRSRTFRTNGYWLITEDNKSIVFNDGAGNFTATIDEGEYHSDADFFAEIKSKMEAVGGETYTISRDPVSKKIKLESSGGAFAVIWTDASNTMADLLGFDDNADSTGATEYAADVIALHTEEHIVWDFGSPVNPQFAALVSSSIEDIALSSGATLQLEASATNNFSFPAETIPLRYDAKAISKWNSSGLASQPYRYWKLKIVDRQNARGFIELSIVQLGSVINFTRGSVQFPFTQIFVDASSSLETIRGGRLTDKRESLRLYSLNWLNLDIQSKQALDDHFFERKTALPFFIMVDPDEVFSSGNYFSTLYATYDRATQASLVNIGSLWTTSHLVREVI